MRSNPDAGANIGSRPSSAAWTLHPALLALGAVTVLGFLALNDQSLWSDELGTWRLTVAQSWAQWLYQLIHWPNSDAQIPLYHLYMRAWVQVFQSSEIALRAANLPWIFLAFFAVLSTPVPASARRLILLIGLVLLLHPMVWYYTDEARPYAMILAGACVAASGLFARLLNGASPTNAAASDARLIVGTTMLCGTSIVGVLWSISFLLPLMPSLVRERWSWRRLSSSNAVLGVVCVLALLPISLLYASTVINGILASVFHENSILSFAFGLYEINGFTGIGPGREELRIAGGAALGPYALALGFYGVAVGGALLVGLWSYARQGRKACFWLLVAAFIPLLMLYALGTLRHWRVVGRHMMPLVVFFAFFLAHGLNRLLIPGSTSTATLVRRLGFGVTLTALCVSSWEISHAPRHEREDFRAAAKMAAGLIASQQRVWWVAQSFGAEYYRLPMVEPAKCGLIDIQGVVLLESPRANALAVCPEPQFIFVGRYDTEGSVAQYSQTHGFHQIGTLTGFEILAK